MELATEPAAAAPAASRPGARAAWRARLHATADPEALLLAESRLPGPRANLELAQAAADELDAATLHRLAALTPATAQAGTPAEFLPLCGAIGLGRLAAAGDPEALPRLRALASDPRWRVREGVAMGLQRLGDADPEALRAAATVLVRGAPLERRAAIAAICEPRLLHDVHTARAALALVDAATLSLLAEPARTREDVHVLRQALGYCWSVAIAALPAEGRPALERWLDSGDADVRWVLRQNLAKRRLERLDPAWAAACRAHLDARGTP